MHCTKVVLCLCKMCVLWHRASLQTVRKIPPLQSLTHSHEMKLTFHLFTVAGIFKK